MSGSEPKASDSEGDIAQAQACTHVIAIECMAPSSHRIAVEDRGISGLKGRVCCMGAELPLIEWKSLARLTRFIRAYPQSYIYAAFPQPLAIHCPIVLVGSTC